MGQPLSGPGGHAVYVTGGSEGTRSTTSYATVAYNPATGARRWVSTWVVAYGCSSIATAVAVSPGGGTAYVTGHGCYIPDALGRATDEYATVAYNAATGEQRWNSRYQGPDNVDLASSLAVGPAGNTVYVTGESLGDINANMDYATVAYQG